MHCPYKHSHVLNFGLLLVLVLLLCGSRYVMLR